MSDTDDLRIAVLGVGLMGSLHAQILAEHTCGARVTVINDFANDRAEEVAAATGARTVLDPFEAIGAADVDAVVIATPGVAHEKQVLACLERGIPVLCEKPLTLDPGSALGIVEAERALGRQLVQVGFMRRFDPEYARLRQVVADGELGSPLLLHCVHRNPDVPPTFTTEMTITDSVVHDIDTVRFLLGEEIVAVSVLKPAATSRAPEGVVDPLVVLFETASGRIADVETFVRTGLEYQVRAELVAEHGNSMIGVTGASGFQQRFRTAYERELQAWVDAAQEGTVTGPDSWDGYAALAVCEAGVEAVRTGRRVEVELAVRP